MFAQAAATQGRQRQRTAELERVGYEGWLVVEQDVVPHSPQDASDAAESQRRNERG
ncbi:MAG: hypothetical protein M3312_09685 [Actinomycetota bacterium]|nr:hypothetical protein [Actinomycetota bacterium]